jgi:hypothetical protein
MKELLDIATRHASSEEAIRTIFVQNSGKAAPNSGQGHHPRQQTRAQKGAP